MDEDLEVYIFKTEDVVYVVPTELHSLLGQSLWSIGSDVISSGKRNNPFRLSEGFTYDVTGFCAYDVEKQKVSPSPTDRSILGHRLFLPFESHSFFYIDFSCYVSMSVFCIFLYN